MTDYEKRVAHILKQKLDAAGLDPAGDDLTPEQIDRIMELTQEAEEEAGSI